METLKFIEDFLFSREFDEEPDLEPFSITIGDRTYGYELYQYNDKWYIIDVD